MRRKTLRDRATETAQTLFARTPRYRPRPPEFLELEVRHCATFEGDIPSFHRSPGIGRMRPRGAAEGETVLNFVCGFDFAHPRPLREVAENVVYTPKGDAWRDGAIDGTLGFREPSLGALARKPKAAGLEVLDRATIIQCEYPDTYGDWVSEHMKSLALAGGAEGPLLLPRTMAGRGYVRGDLDRQGIERRFLDRPVLIRRALVLRKARPINYWDRDEAEAYRRFMGVQAPAPRPGSLVYLSREGVASEQLNAARVYPHAEIGAAVEALGGRVVRTAELRGFDDFAALAGEAETVVADHGAAMFNLLQWRTRNVVEIVTDSWWSSCFVFLSAACGAERHAVVRAGPAAEAETGMTAAARTEAHLARWGAGRETVRPAASGGEKGGERGRAAQTAGAGGGGSAAAEGA